MSSTNIPIKVERKEDVPVYYAESVQIGHTLTSFKLVIFNDKPMYANEARVGREALIPRSIVKEVVAEVILSPQQFKILEQIISQQLQMYETKFGKINLPNQPPKKDNSTATYI